MTGWVKKLRSSMVANSLFGIVRNMATTQGKPDIPRAVHLAHERLLLGKVPEREVADLAKSLALEPTVYSTEDLALSAALNFFRRPENRPIPREVESVARFELLVWLMERRINPVIVSAFEATLCNEWNQGGSE